MAAIDCIRVLGREQSNQRLSLLDDLVDVLAGREAFHSDGWLMLGTHLGGAMSEPSHVLKQDRPGE